MKTVIDILLKNPIFKFIGIFTILYFALYANKKDPQSLGNRLSKENIKKNFKEVKKKSHFIINNVSKAKQAKEVKQKTVKQ